MQAIPAVPDRPSAVAERDAHLCSGVPSISKWYRYSLLRILVEEICRFPRRIVAAIRTPDLRWGYSISPYPKDHCEENLALRSNFVSACSESIRQLRRDKGWMGTLDSDIAAEAFRAGAAWAIDSLCSDSEKTSIQSQPCAFPSTFTRHHLHAYLALYSEHQRVLQDCDLEAEQTGIEKQAPTFFEFLEGRGHTHLAKIYRLADAQVRGGMLHVELEESLHG